MSVLMYTLPWLLTTLKGSKAHWTVWQQVGWWSEECRSPSCCQPALWSGASCPVPSHPQTLSFAAGCRSQDIHQLCSTHLNSIPLQKFIFSLCGIDCMLIYSRVPIVVFLSLKRDSISFVNNDYIIFIKLPLYTFYSSLYYTYWYITCVVYISMITKITCCS